MNRLLVLLVVVLLRSAGVVQAQEPVLSESARISLLTVLPGEALYSMYGHSALRVYDPVRGIDESFNYGTFDFDALFLPKFLYGRLDYFLSHYPFPLAARHYREVEERPVIEQVLALDAAQREALFRFLRHNARPENRYYSYNFLLDNCSTRIRDALVETLGGAVRFGPAPDSTATFRDLLDPYQGSFVDAGIDLLMGAPVDRPAASWEAMFLPDHLMAAFDRATLGTGAGTRPLVARTDTLVWIDGYTRSDPALPWASLALWAFLLLGLVVTYRGYRTGRRVSRVFDGVLFLLAGVVGLLIAFLWFVSLHDVTAQNWNLLWAWPTHLLLVVPLFRGRAGRLWMRRYLYVTALMALLALAGWWVWPQELPAALLPLLLLLALRSAWIAGVPPARPI